MYALDKINKNKDKSKWTSLDESFFDMSYICHPEKHLKYCVKTLVGPSKFSCIVYCKISKLLQGFQNQYFKVPMLLLITGLLFML